MVDATLIVDKDVYDELRSYPESRIKILNAYYLSYHKMNIRINCDDDIYYELVNYLRNRVTILQGEKYV